MPRKRNKKIRQEKWKKRGGENQKNYREIFLFAHAWALQANVLHLDQKAPTFMTCKWLYGKF